MYIDHGTKHNAGTTFIAYQAQDSVDNSIEQMISQRNHEKSSSYQMHDCWTSELKQN